MVMNIGLYADKRNKVEVEKISMLKWVWPQERTECGMIVYEEILVWKILKEI